jgi:hypothetical protein
MAVTHPGPALLPAFDIQGGFTKFGIYLIRVEVNNRTQNTPTYIRTQLAVPVGTRNDFSPPFVTALKSTLILDLITDLFAGASNRKFSLIPAVEQRSQEYEPVKGYDQAVTIF